MDFEFVERPSFIGVGRPQGLSKRALALMKTAETGQALKISLKKSEASISSLRSWAHRIAKDHGLKAHVAYQKNESIALIWCEVKVDSAQTESA